MLKRIILRNAAADNWLLFNDPVDIIDVDTLEDVVPSLQLIEARVNNENLYAAGFVSYEASPAFDAACSVKHDAGFPLLRFGLFASVQEIEQLNDASATADIQWQMDSAPAYYRQKIAQIKTHIHAGNTYQVNFTVRQHGEGVDDPWALFLQLGSESPYSAYIECDDWAICCASPELFFSLDSNRLESRPMKGTASRGETLREDEEQKSWLRNSLKNRAENVMIVDMIRNDMGRVAKSGSVGVENLFRIETYPTVLQMTSTVNAKTEKSVTDIFRALFPCASITGAPKINTMRLITELEDSPRRIYTGTIGYIAPNRKALFNVAIRTALVNRRNGHACYGSGGGIVWDSSAAEEFEEINTKSKILGLRTNRRYFQIFESLLWDGSGYFLLDRHIDRMIKSIGHFSFAGDVDSINFYLYKLSQKLPESRCKVRLLISEDGTLASEFAEIPDAQDKPVKVGLATNPVDENTVWLAHKTTVRNLYNEARASRADTDDVLLWNRHSNLTESSTANILVKREGHWVTPRLESGLLAGTHRAELLQAGKITEDDLPVHALESFDEIRLLNSVRKWIEIDLN